MSSPEGLGRLKEGYTVGARRLAARSMEGLARTRVSPNALTATGVALCLLSGVIVYFEYRHEVAAYWIGATLFTIGSILDILDGALARRSSKATPFGAFLDSTTDRVGEAFMLGAIALVFARHGNEVALAFAIAAIGGSLPRELHEGTGGSAWPQRRRRHRKPRRAGRGDRDRPRASTVGRAPVGDLSASSDGVAHCSAKSAISSLATAPTLILC